MSYDIDLAECQDREGNDEEAAEAWTKAADCHEAEDGWANAIQCHLKVAGKKRNNTYIIFGRKECVYMCHKLYSMTKRLISSVSFFFLFCL